MHWFVIESVIHNYCSNTLAKNRFLKHAKHSSPKTRTVLDTFSVYIFKHETRFLNNRTRFPPLVLCQYKRPKTPVSRSVPLFQLITFPTTLVGANKNLHSFRLYYSERRPAELLPTIRTQLIGLTKHFVFVRLSLPSPVLSLSAWTASTC